MKSFAQTIATRLGQRRRTEAGIFKLLSFLLFSLLCIGTITFFPGLLWPLTALIVIDGLGTMLTRTDWIASADRAFFFFLVVVWTLLRSSANVFFLTLEILCIVATLDFSFLLRKLDGTNVDSAVLTGRLRSYAYTMLPAFLLTYVLLYLYSFNFQFTDAQAVIVLSLAAVGALVVIYTVSRYLFSFDKREEN